VVVEAHPVDQRPVGGQADQPRLRITGLRLRRHGAYLDEREAKSTEGANADGVLVEARRQTQRARQLPAERVDPKDGITWC
jgi:hypothetical protein